MVSDTFRVLYGGFLALRSVEEAFGTDLAAKNMIFSPKLLIFPVWFQILAETEFGRKINGSRPSDGAQWATGGQIL